MSMSNVISGQHVMVVKTPTPVAVAQETCGDEPRISIIKDGDVVRAIEVVCTCGEVIRLDCVY
jgi:hypothetical protein